MKKPGRTEGLPGLILLGAGSVLLLLALASSRSASPVLLERYSAGLAIAMTLILLLTSGAVLLVTTRSDRLVRLLGKLAGRPPLIELLMALTLPAVFLLWLLRPAQVLDRPAFVLGLVLVPVGVAILLAGHASRERRVRALQHAALILGALVSAAAVGELLARLLMPRVLLDPRFQLKPHMAYRIEADLPGVSQGGVASTNSLGLRGEEPPEDFESWLTIVTVGGSTTNNFLLEDSRTWSAVLQSRLREQIPNTWVGNAGTPAQTASMNAVMIRDAISTIRPDYIIVLAGINEVGAIIRGVPPSAGELQEGDLRTDLFRRSRLIQALYILKKVHLEGVVVVTSGEIPGFDIAPMPCPEGPLPDDLHQVMPEPEAYRNSIREIARACREAGSVPVFLTQPLLYDDTEYWRGIRSESVWLGECDSVLSAATLWLILDTLNRDLIETCSAEGEHCFDLAAHVPHSTDMFWDCMHLTEDGAGLVGGLVAGFMLDEVLELPIAAE